MELMLSPEEMKREIGLSEADAMAAYSHGLSDFRVVVRAQARKILDRLDHAETIPLIFGVIAQLRKEVEGK